MADYYFALKNISSETTRHDSLQKVQQGIEIDQQQQQNSWLPVLL